MTEPRHISEWHEGIGDVLWWMNPVTERPYVGSPLDCGQTVSVVLFNAHGKQVDEMKPDVGGWPGYHEWWTPLPPAPTFPAPRPPLSREGRRMIGPSFLRKHLMCRFSLCETFTTQSNDVAVWGACMICHRRAGYTSREALRRYADAEARDEAAKRLLQRAMAEAASSPSGGPRDE